MRLPTQEELDRELGDLFQRRGELDNKEWARLYELVSITLLPFRPSILSTLPSERRDYVDQFFTEKVYGTRSKSRSVHQGALREFYENFLRDELRKQNRFSKMKDRFSQQIGYTRTVSKTGREGEADSGSGAADEVEAHLRIDAGSDSHTTSATPHFEDGTTASAEVDPGTLPLDDRKQIEPPNLMSSSLADTHMANQVSRSARRWLAASEEWVPAYLAFSFCPDKEKREPLVKLAARLRISSYHYKATRLGINWDGRKSRGTGKGFAETLIGQWVSKELGLELRPENASDIDLAFSLLCIEALSWGDTLEASR